MFTFFLLWIALGIVFGSLLAYENIGPGVKYTVADVVMGSFFGSIFGPFTAIFYLMFKLHPYLIKLMSIELFTKPGKKELYPEWKNR